ncbi:EF-hand domain-containing protein [Sphingomonas sp.]|uniref:EF-hand domain-containing protein n=1 Tax=Sphingomonas sp. TaxID=28214 RepID=UPI0035C86E20
MKFRLLIAAILVSTPVVAFAQSNQMEVFERADANRDGLITLAEFKAARTRQFDRFDRNGDGAISQADVGRIAQFRPEIGQRLNMLIQTADANHDRRVTKPEFAASPAPLFERADVNRDGVVDKAELAVLRQALDNER